MTDCTRSTTLSRKCKKRSIHVNFDGGDVSCIGGIELLRAADDRLGLCKAASNVLSDPRDPNKSVHRWEDLFRQRVFAIAAGFANLNDHSQLRLDAALQCAVGSLNHLASASTLCRFEAAAAQPTLASTRRAVFEMHRLLLEQFVASFDTPPSSLILDFDGTDDRVHGEQEGRQFNSHYGGYGFFPLYVYCGEKLLVSYLRPLNRPDSHHAGAVLRLLVNALRAHWPDVQILFRADAGFYRPLIVDWCERSNVRYLVGFRSNAALKRETQLAVDTLADAWAVLERAEADLPCLKVFQDITYRAHKWWYPRRTIAKLEHNAIGANQRFVVTNCEGDAEQLYSDVYCERGTMENRHKELQMGLFADRTSCTAWWSNQLRVMLSSFAYVLWQTVREVGLTGTSLARAQVWTLRQRLVQIGAVVLRNTRRVELRLSRTALEQDNYLIALKRLEGT